MTDYLDTIRNICIIAHVDHGKSSLSDTLMAAGGLIAFDDAGKKRLTDTRDDEAERGITIKSTGVSLNINHDDKPYIINLVDTPGHIDFNSEVSAAIRITDGAVVLVDSVEGVSAQTETVLRQALAENLTPMLVINKIDRYFTELQLNGEEAYEKLRNIIYSVNNMISMYQPENPTVLDPLKGNVLFTCARYNWGFSIKTFAGLYAKKSGKESSSYMKILWGDSYFDPNTKKVTSAPMGNVRCFSQFIYTPLKNAIVAMQNNDPDTKNILEKAFMTIVDSDKRDAKDGDDLARRTLRRTFLLAPLLVDAVINHLPSPKVSQSKRVDVLYTGPQDHPTYKGIRDCDPEAPLMIYISKMIPTGNGGTFYAFGRVFSGTVHTGQKVTILGANYEHGEKNDMFVDKSIQRVVKMVGNKTESADELKCGNTVALIGVSDYLIKSGTVTTCPDRYPIKTMKFSVSPVVRVAVAPKNAAEISKFTEGLKRLSKSDPCLKVELTSSGDFVIGGAGKLHIEIAIHDLKDFLNDMDIIVSEPVVPYKETVSKLSEVCLSKSPNKHNRLYCTAEPLPEEVVKDFESGDFSLKDQQKLVRRLVDVHGWEKTTVLKIWAISNGNVLVDGTHGISYLNEIRDSMVGAFLKHVEEAGLCKEPLRGVKFELKDAMLHADAIHRGGGQIIPTAQRVFTASQLLAGPRLMEPIYKVTIQVDSDNKNKVFGVMNRKRGYIISEEQVHGLPLWNLIGTLPVAESFDFDEVLKQATSGKGLPSCVFSHYEIIESDPMNPDDDSKVNAYRIALDVIAKHAKGNANRKVELPNVSDFLDKL